MAYEQLKEAIRANIKQNGNEEITGQVMQTTLLSIVNNIGKEVVQDIGDGDNVVLSQQAVTNNVYGNIYPAVNILNILSNGILQDVKYTEGYVQINGTVDQSADWKHTDKIPINTYNYAVIATKVRTSVSAVIFYNGDHIVGYTNANENHYIGKIQSNITHIVINCLKPYTASISLSNSEDGKIGLANIDRLIGLFCGNIVNPNYINGELIRRNGVLTRSNDWVRSESINVQDGDYVAVVTRARDAAPAIAFYQDDVFIGCTPDNQNTFFTRINGGVNKIVVNCLKPNNAFISIGSYDESICGFIDKTNSDLKYLLGIEDISYTSIENGYFIKSDGTIVTSAGRMIANYDVVSGGVYQVQIHQSGNAIGTSASIISMWNSDIFIDNELSSVSELDYKRKILIPKNVNKLRLSISSSFGWSIQINKINNAEDDKTYKAITKNTLGSKIYPSSIIKNKFVKPSGVIADNTDRNIICYTGLKERDQLFIQNYQSVIALGSGGSFISFWFNGIFVKSFISGWNDPDIQYTEHNIVIPSGVNEVRISTDNRDGSYIKTFINPKFINFWPQIYTGHYPIKQSGESINILIIGSSWGVDSISALSRVAKASGVSVNTGNLYQSSGSFRMYIDDEEKGIKNTFFFNEDGVDNATSKLVSEALEYKNWDYIIMMNNATTSVNYPDNLFNPDFDEFFEYVIMHNPYTKTIYCLNSTWTEQLKQYQQQDAFNVVNYLAKQGGISLIVPTGAALLNLRKTSLNDGNDIYRDGIHIVGGIGRFTTACALYYALIYPINGIGLENNTYTGSAEQAIGDTLYPDIPVTNENRQICIDCAKKAVANRFKL